jgi:hypothetical protein
MILEEYRGFTIALEYGRLKIYAGEDWLNKGFPWKVADLGAWNMELQGNPVPYAEKYIDQAISDFEKPKYAPPQIPPPTTAIQPVQPVPETPETAAKIYIETAAAKPIQPVAVTPAAVTPAVEAAAVKEEVALTGLGLGLLLLLALMLVK